MSLMTLMALIAPALTGDVKAQPANSTVSTHVYSAGTVSAPGGYNKSKPIVTSVNFTDTACLAGTIRVPAPIHAANSNGNSPVFLPLRLLCGVQTFPVEYIFTAWQSEIHAYQYAISFPHHHFW